MVKKYTLGSLTRTRTLEKLVSGTVKAGVNGVEQTITTHYTVDLNTGIITFVTAPPNGQDVTAGCEFRVPARFDFDSLPATFQAFQSMDWDVPIVEITGTSDTQVPSDFVPRGSYDHGEIGSDVSISLTQGILHRVDPNTSGLEIILPSADNIPAGGLMFVLFNDGSDAMDLVATAGGSSLISVPSDGSLVFVMLFEESDGTKTWKAR
jgi:hypothetical protein